MDLLKQIAQEVKSGKPLEAIAQAYGLSLKWIEAVTRTNAFKLL